MHISVEANDDTIDTLALKIGRLFDDNAGLTHREILTALLNLISTTLVSIECPSCRAFAAQCVGNVMQQIIDNAFSYAAEHDDDVPPPSEHLH